MFVALGKVYNNIWRNLSYSVFLCEPFDLGEGWGGLFVEGCCFQCPVGDLIVRVSLLRQNGHHKNFERGE